MSEFFDDKNSELEDFNVAQMIMEKYQSRILKDIEPLQFTYSSNGEYDDDNENENNMDDDEISDSGSIPDDRFYDSDEDSEYSDNDSSYSHTAEDDDDDDIDDEDDDEYYSQSILYDSDEEDEENLIKPNKLAKQIYRFQHDFTIVECISNKRRRKIYKAIRKSDQKPVIIIVTHDIHHRYTKKNHLPREIRIMHRLRNTNHIGQILGHCLINSRTYAIVMDYYINCNVVKCTQGNIVLIKEFMQSLLQGIVHLHAKNVVHRDISIDNVMFNPITKDVVIIDFDLSSFNRSSGFYRHVGRDKYDAPEKVAIWNQMADMWDSDQTNLRVTKKAYTSKVDIYSAGVLFYMLIFQELHSPKPKTLRKVLKKLKKKKKHRKHAELDLLLKMLAYKPDNRCTAEEALNHSFFQHLDEKDNIIHVRKAERIQKFIAMMMEDNHTVSTFTSSDEDSGEDDEDNDVSSSDDDEKNDKDHDDVVDSGTTHEKESLLEGDVVTLHDAHERVGLPDDDDDGDSLESKLTDSQDSATLP